MSREIVPIADRRSGAGNVAPPHLQSIFINAARTAMGQPDEDEAIWCLNKLVLIKFNGDRESVVGVLTRIIRHPTTGGDATYLILDNREQTRYALNSIQSIELVRSPLELPEPSDDDEDLHPD